MNKKFPVTFFLIFLLGICYSYGQNISVSGNVSDQEGLPIPGVTVLLKNTSNGVVTDFDGNYQINVPANGIVVFSFIGYTTKEIAIDSRSVIDVSLEEDLGQLDEVIVVGFGTQKKVNLTGAVGVVDGEKLESRPVQNASQMLQGLVAGLNISSTGGSLEDRSTINVRGTGTIGQGSTGSPLILIDGMEGDINAINPQDIESISVLKDAAASSIYGSRAPFGVILVTTKTGKKGKPVINYNTNIRVSSPINVPNMMDSYTYALFFNDAHVNGGEAPFFSEERLQAILNYQQGLTRDEIIQNPNNPQIWADGYASGQANNDWYDLIYKESSFSQEHNISVSGGSEDIQYYASGNYLDQNGLMQFNTDNFNRYATTIKLDAQITDWAKVSVSNRFIREDFGRPSALNDGLFENLARQGWPMLPLYDPNGFLYSSPSPALGLAEGGRDKSQTDWLYQQGELILEPVKDFLITGRMSYRTQNNFRHWDTQKTYNHDVDGNPVPYGTSNLVHEQGFRENYLNATLLNEYSKEIGEGHNFKVLLGYQSELNKTRFLSAERDGIIVPPLPTLNTTSGTDANGVLAPPVVAGDYNHWSTQGVFGRLNYNYKERYLLEGNLRYDGTSRFRNDKRWNWFPSVSAGWNVAKEPFWESLENTINTFKFRGSYGELGNQNTNSWYPTYVTMPIGTANGGWLVNAAQPNTSSAPGLVSESLTWERVKSWNAGLDVALFNNRLSGSFDYFTRYTTDMVGPAPELPVILGTAVPVENNTDLKTYGFEVNLNWRDQLKNGLGYNINILLSDAQTEITKYPNETGTLSTYVQDRTIGEIWGYETVDIARYAGEMEAHLASLPNGGQDALGSQWAQGDIMYKDLNGDGTIDSGAYTENDHGDLKVIGNNTPRYSFSVDLNADWKNFDARIFFQGILKRDYYVNSYYFWGAWDWGRWWSTGLEPHTDYYRADADHPLGQNIDSYYPRPLFNGKNHQAQTGYLQDASYIRLKNLQFGYSLPEDAVAKLGIHKLRLYVSGENLWTGTNMTEIFDPETIDDSSTGNNYPLNRTISYGLSVNF
ncbi:TonB-dependent receptor [Gramella sp. AN32]|uniref:SusC/RagA family TonB-linked outer membrane protein n=1 Tax=Christiangramia antarctica TaxID=2058158 RepID=A0ABW5XB21_9FLAO|nr:TonB-dependent receptor [Gramella sp. AN32]